MRQRRRGGTKHRAFMGPTQSVDFDGSHPSFDARCRRRDTPRTTSARAIRSIPVSPGTVCAIFGRRLKIASSRCPSTGDAASSMILEGARGPILVSADSRECRSLTTAALRPAVQHSRHWLRVSEYWWPDSFGSRGVLHRQFHEGIRLCERRRGRAQRLRLAVRDLLGWHRGAGECTERTTAMQVRLRKSRTDPHTLRTARPRCAKPGGQMADLDRSSLGFTFAFQCEEPAP
jgi:hypothetical protein